METQVRTPNAIFGQPQRLLVPLFQRPYVWNEEQQWEPLWKDLERVASRLLSNPQGKHSPHFLGAVVLQQIHSALGDLPARVIIDGQQRLTTLQILLDALDGELRRAGATVQADRLEYLIENDKRFWKNPEDRFKVWPTNRDRPAFNEVMGTPSPVDHTTLKNADARLVKAHAYFSQQGRSWLACEDASEREFRADAIERSARELLQIVVIDLAPDENAQEIFETLNARGAQLTAADLIKNFIFQKLLDSGADVGKTYERYWKDFETAFWEAEVSAGRLRHQRSSLFINHWLISRTGEEVPAREVFSRFKWYTEHDAKASIEELLKELYSASQVYRSTTEASESTSGELDGVGLFSYRLRSMEIDVMKSVILALLADPTREIAASVVESTLAAIESWLVRRMLVRASTKSYGQAAAEIVGIIRQSDATRVDQSVRAFLLSQKSEHRYWPDDEEVTRELARIPIYRRLSRARLRMVLEAIEDHHRGYHPTRKQFAGMRVARSGFHIEHLMPQSWEAKWPLQLAVSKEERSNRIHLLGNLTLLTSRLNASVSNGPWNGESGKHAAIQKHDILLLNRDLDKFSALDWTDEAILLRTQQMTNAILEIWTVPTGYRSGTVTDSNRGARAVELSDLISSGMLTPGQILTPRPVGLRQHSATVLPDGRLDMGGKVFESPSGAAHPLRRRATNGWSFWLIDAATKRSLATIRREYMENASIDSDGFDDDEDVAE